MMDSDDSSDDDPDNRVLVQLQQYSVEISKIKQFKYNQVVSSGSRRSFDAGKERTKWSTSWCRQHGDEEEEDGEEERVDFFDGWWE